MNFFKKALDLFKKSEWKLDIVAPVDGKIVSLKQVPDPVFAEGSMGEGVAIIPTNGDVIVPFSGKLVAAFKTGHAFFIKEKKQDISVLIHLGIDTVNIPMEEKAFTPYYKQDDMVTINTALASMKLDVIHKHKYPDHIIILVQNENLNDKKIIFHRTSGNIKKGELLMSVVFNK